MSNWKPLWTHPSAVKDPKVLHLFKELGSLFTPCLEGNRFFPRDTSQNSLQALVSKLELALTPCEPCPDSVLSTRKRKRVHLETEEPVASSSKAARRSEATPSVPSSSANLTPAEKGLKVETRGLGQWREGAEYVWINHSLGITKEHLKVISHDGQEDKVSHLFKVVIACHPNLRLANWGALTAVESEVIKDVINFICSSRDVMALDDSFKISTLRKKLNQAKRNKVENANKTSKRRQSGVTQRRYSLTPNLSYLPMFVIKPM